jgi:response regulator RpfG family c-di-GMP phosphodiesterase
MIENPVDALLELEKNDYDLVLSDFNMPNMNGVEFLNKVKQRYPDVARLLITATPDYQIAKDAINKAQIDNFIEKPWYNDELRAVIHNTLKQKYDDGSKCSIKVDDLDEALTILRVAKNNLFCYNNLYGQKRIVNLEFKSSKQFNRFYQRIKEMKNVNIDDIQIYDDKYLIKLIVS